MSNFLMQSVFPLKIKTYATVFLLFCGGLLISTQYRLHFRHEKKN